MLNSEAPQLKDVSCTKLWSLYSFVLIPGIVFKLLALKIMFLLMHKALPYTLYESSFLYKSKFLLLNNYRCWGVLLLHVLTHNDTLALGRTLLDEISVLRRDLYLHNTHKHKRQTSMGPAGFDPAIPASERSKGYAPEPTDYYSLIRFYLTLLITHTIIYRTWYNWKLAKTNICNFLI